MECNDSPLMDIHSCELIGRMNSGQSRKVFLPDNIPLHPEVFHARRFCRESFLRRVISQLPAEMQSDLKQIETATGCGLNMQIVDDGILCRGKKISFSRFDIGSDPENGILEVSFNKAGMAITGSQNHEGFLLEGAGEIGRDLFHNLKGYETFRKIQHPMVVGSSEDIRGSRKLESYVCESCSKEKSDRYFHVWYIEGLRQAILPFRHFCRNFAILVNNLGLAQIRKKPRDSRIIS